MVCVHCCQLSRSSGRACHFSEEYQRSAAKSRRVGEDTEHQGGAGEKRQVGKDLDHQRGAGENRGVGADVDHQKNAGRARRSRMAGFLRTRMVLVLLNQVRRALAQIGRPRSQLQLHPHLHLYTFRLHRLCSTASNSSIVRSTASSGSIVNSSGSSQRSVAVCETAATQRADHAQLPMEGLKSSANIDGATCQAGHVVEAVKI